MKIISCYFLNIIKIYKIKGKRKYIPDGSTFFTAVSLTSEP